jgi:hypothetical protein
MKITRIDTGLFRTILIIPIFILCAFQAKAQVKVSLQYPSAFQFVPGDLWNVTLENSSSSTKRVFLKGMVKTGTQKTLFEVHSSPFDLPPGTHIYSPITVSTARTAHFDPTIQNALNNTGEFPAGAYITCVAVFEEQNTIRQDENCVENNVEIISPPILVSPEHQSNPDNLNPTFTWIPPSPIRNLNRVQYDFVLVELFDHQSSLEGILRNPPYYFETGLNQTVQPYPITALPLNFEKRYAWQITARIDDYIVGKSEIWEFVIKKKTVELDTIVDTHNFLQLTKQQGAGYYIANEAVKFQ